MEIDLKIRVRLHQFSARLRQEFTRPLQKFIQQMLFGMLDTHSILLNQIARNLGEKSVLKKTAARLGNHLAAPGFWSKLLLNLLETQRYYLRQCQYMVLDFNSIAKEHALKMEGLAMISDEKQARIGPGYWWINFTAINTSGELLVPAYSEIFSAKSEATPESVKLLNIIQLIHHQVKRDFIWVEDREQDEKSLLESLLATSHQFIVRLTGNRNLYYQQKSLPISVLGRKVKLTVQFTVQNQSTGEPTPEIFGGGSIKVRLTRDGKELRLIVLHSPARGFTWLLCQLNAETPQIAIRTALGGYLLKRKAEAIHQQIKTDFQLETICLQKYTALKAMNALLWSLTSFLYSRQLRPVAVQCIIKNSNHPAGRQPVDLSIDSNGLTAI
ncbi:hypothetical protein L0128_12190 [candidate division KSB1 bacterium]|nr:hypothetical protein [candidate division KSB1 bacterium]